jgi:zinc-ribbon domain
VKLPALKRHAVAAPRAVAAPPAEPVPDAELVAQRERLTERFALMQSELGGLFYEMAIRDHVRLDVLVGKAAALQRVDAELAQVEHLLTQSGGAVGGRCSNCGTAHARGAAFCSQCATPLLTA